MNLTADQIFNLNAQELKTTLLKNMQSISKANNLIKQMILENTIILDHLAKEGLVYNHINDRFDPYFITLLDDGVRSGIHVVECNLFNRRRPDDPFGNTIKGSTRVHVSVSMLEFYLRTSHNYCDCKFYIFEKLQDLDRGKIGLFRHEFKKLYKLLVEQKSVRSKLDLKERRK